MEGSSKDEIEGVNKEELEGRSKEEKEGRNKEEIEGTNKEEIESRSKEEKVGSNKEGMEGNNTEELEESNKEGMVGSSTEEIKGRSKEDNEGGNKEDMEGSDKEEMERSRTEKLEGSNKKETEGSGTEEMEGSEGEKSNKGATDSASFQDIRKKFDVIQKPLIPKSPESLSVNNHASLDWITKGGKVASHNAGDTPHSMSKGSLPVDWLTKGGQVSSHQADVMLASGQAFQRSLPARTPKQAAEESAIAEEYESTTGVKEKMRQLEHQIQHASSRGASPPALGVRNLTSSPKPTGAPRTVSLTTGAPRTVSLTAAGGAASKASMGVPLAAKGRSISAAFAESAGGQRSGGTASDKGVLDEDSASLDSYCVSSNLFSPPTAKGGGGSHRLSSSSSSSPGGRASLSRSIITEEEEEEESEAAFEGAGMLGGDMDVSQLCRRIIQLEIQLRASRIRENTAERALAARGSASRRMPSHSLKAHKTGDPLEAQENGHPLEAQGTGHPLEAQGTGHPLEAQGRGHPPEAQGTGHPLEAQNFSAVVQPFDNDCLKAKAEISVMIGRYMAGVGEMRSMNKRLEQAEADLAAIRNNRQQYSRASGTYGG